MAEYFLLLDGAGLLNVPDPDWASKKLLGLVMPPLPMMCPGFELLNIPSVDDVRKCIHLFMKGMESAV